MRPVRLLLVVGAWLLAVEPAFAQAEASSDAGASPTPPPQAAPEPLPSEPPPSEPGPPAPTPPPPPPQVPPQAPAPASGAAPTPPGDGWPDVSSFLDDRYGFLPIAAPITEPAVGYGAAGGLMFLSKSFGDVKKGLGRPNITFVGGMGTSNGSWGFFGADVRYWLEDHLQTVVAGVVASVNLDFYGLGHSDVLANAPLRYNLMPKGGLLQAKYRFGNTSFWAGLSGQFFSTEVRFAAREGTPGLPEYNTTSNLGGGSALVTYDSRDNVFTPLRGTYVELTGGVFGECPDGKGAFGRADLIAIQYVPLPLNFYLGMRGQVTATFGSAPFYFRPYVGMRGIPLMRHQGEEIAQIEAELRWQFWKRWSLLAFGGGGGAWNQFEKLSNASGIFAAGGGFRYEIARKYGMHVGVDVAGSVDTAAFYIQVGSAWMRP